ncbi:MAG: hypothetical protein B0A82_15310 [Alkalinema sp. CACIAM 70d]|nr:MAG: hypothetical protein B0A82_15310 [Alkalinema sp. CACIAM 70d]
MIGGALFNGSVLANSDDRVLVLVFLRGGFDGLNAVVPYGDDSYYTLRPTIAVRQPSAANSASAIDLNGFFGCIHLWLRYILFIKMGVLRYCQLSITVIRLILISEVRMLLSRLRWCHMILAGSAAIFFNWVVIFPARPWV